MHLFSSSISLLLLVPAIVASQAQTPFSEDQRPLRSSTLELDPPPEPPTPLLTSTLVDVLSADPSYSTLIRLLQRTKLIPTLNKLNGSTLFAPTNDALERASVVDGSLWSSLAIEELEAAWDNQTRPKRPDNILYGLRQSLLYHLLNHTLPYAPLQSSLADESDTATLFPDASAHQPEMLETMLFPSRYSGHKTPEPAPAPPWLPDRRGLLGRDGQRVRGVRRVGAEGDGSKGQDWVGVDWQGEGGIRVLEVRESANGIVVKVDGVLEEPKNAAETLLAHPSLSYLSALLLPSNQTPRYPLPDPSPPSPYPIPPYSPLSPLRSSTDQTLFAPSDTAFSRLPRIERSYLESGFAQEDIAWIVGAHASASSGGQAVGWRETFRDGGEVQVGGGGKLWVEVDKEDGGMRVGLVEGEKGSGGERKDKGIKVVEPDILCENGVIHIIDDLLLPPGSFKLTAEKTLIGLNATFFVTLLRSANLTSYIDSSASSSSYTILAPLDSFLDPSTSSSPRLNPVPSPGSKSLADILKLHILPGRLRPKNLRDGALVESEMKLASLKDGNQVVKVKVRKSLGGLGDAIPIPGSGGDDDDDDTPVEAWEEISFSNVDVVAAPIEVGRSIIYLVTSFLPPPEDFVQTSVSDLRLSTFVAASFSSGVEKELKSAPGVTFFMPRNDAFRGLGLAMDYLLRPEAKDELKQVLRAHVVDEVLYRDDLVSSDGKSGKSYRTLEGGNLVVSVDKAGNITVGGETRDRDGEKLNGEFKDADVLVTDMLTANGVIHQINQVELPSSLSLTLSKLLHGSPSSKTMTDLLLHADLGWVLNGTSPPPSDLARLGIQSFGPPATTSSSPALSFTLLAPTDEAFGRLNLTHYLSSPDDLLSLLALHIIPSRAPIPLTPQLASRSTAALLSPPTDGRPLSLVEEVPYLTLLSATSRYGDLSFRREGGGEGGKGRYVVGIVGARGEEDGENDWAEVGRSGRGTGPRLVEDEDEEGEGGRKFGEEGKTEGERRRGRGLLVNGVSRGGGVIVISTVLVPFHPTWIMIWGWTVLAIVVGSIAGLTALGLLGFWLWTRRVTERTDYEPLDNEED